MAEDKCLALISETNKPFNGVADMLASQGFKKPQVERALAALAEASKITCKEFGKTKIYIPLQDGLPELDPAEKDAKMERIGQLQQECKDAQATVAAHQKELGTLKSALTVQELQTQLASRQRQLEEAEAKLAGHVSGGTEVIRAEDVQTAEQKFSKGLEAWERFKKAFRNVWSTVSENLDTSNQADLFEEMGVDTDEGIGEDLASYQALLPGRKKARKA